MDTVLNRTEAGTQNHLAPEAVKLPVLQGQEGEVSAIETFFAGGFPGMMSLRFGVGLLGRSRTEGPVLH